MPGYFRDPERTREALGDDGWMRSGDIGVIDDDGYLRIVDRKKALIISSSGKNMSPASIEQAIKGGVPLIAQVVVFGDAGPYNVALIVLDRDGLAALCAARASQRRRSPSSRATRACWPRSTRRFSAATRGCRASSRSSATRCSTTSGCPRATR